MNEAMHALRAAVHAVAAAIMTTAAVATGSAAVPTDAPVTVTLDAPKSADGFLDSMGMNVHFGYRDTGYANVPAVERLLATLHVRHIRDATIGVKSLCSVYRNLAASGVRTDFVTSVDQNPSTYAAWASCVGPGLEMFEGPNEYNVTGGNWAQRLRAFQQRMYSTVKGTPSIAATPVVAPSLTVSDAYRTFGDASAISDIGNSHDYFLGYNPGAGGWCGATTAGDKRPWAACAIADSYSVTSQPKPVFATESGYGTGNSLFAVSSEAQAKYVPRLFLEQFNEGFARVYEYELVDEGTDGYNGYGIVDKTLQPKQSYRALSGLITALGTTGDATAAPAFPITLIAPSQTIHHTYLQRGGILSLVLWIEKSSYNPKTHVAYVVAPQQVQVQLPSIPASATQWLVTGTSLRENKLQPATTLTLTVSDWPSVLQIVPQGVRISLAPAITVVARRSDVSAVAATAFLDRSRSGVK